MRILVVPDKFKGTLSARAAAQAIARGWRRARPSDAIELCPISDGGDGFGAVLGQVLGARACRVRTVNAAHQPCPACWWWGEESATVVVESAQVIGLALLPPGRFHPFELDTFGLGAVLQAAARRGARRCVVGIGGSATNDGGFGLARALGWRFYDRRGGPLERWTELDRLARIVPPARRLLFRSLTVAVDVQNPLLGPHGATRIYGPQKGLRPEDFPKAEACLRRLALVVRRTLGRDWARAPGAGAAGGLGFGLAAFAGARFAPGFALMARECGLARRLGQADLVITGEGALDRSTLMGKGTGEVARLCRQRGIPCLALGGHAANVPALSRFFVQVRSLGQLTSREESLARAAFWLERLAEQVARQWPGATRRPRPGRAR